MKDLLEERVMLHKDHPKYFTNYFNYLGLKDIVVYQGVFRPEISPVTIAICNWLTENKEQCYKKNVCDLGCGSGVFSIIIAKNGAKKVTSIDTDPSAIQNTRENANLHKINKIICIKSNLFQSLKKERFDLIISNFPLITRNKTVDTKYLSVLTNGSVADELWKGMKKHLKKDGIVIFPNVYIEGFKTLSHDDFAVKNGFHRLTIIENKLEYRQTIIHFQLHKYCMP
ncbi:MAG: methyltransferase [Nanoarchaeota archaeon]|nr:methyltransferase [Nanoarchaeota archaeon]MBU1321001.1 methyltransferase [Nanoarchaeota archaeon]MBU1596872.1 methyltransferase [Nanoarchaeota archaeon]MBU2440789.1 methyltransferase [Nanoarchaeota archaeon]